jgi:hypothetical protein
MMMITERTAVKSPETAAASSGLSI